MIKLANLLVLGFGGHGKVLLEAAFACKRFTNVVFLDDHFNNIDGKRLLPDVQLLGPFSMALDEGMLSDFPSAAVAVGNPITRLSWLHQLEAFGYELPALIHPTAWVSPSAAIGRGSVVFAQAAVQSHVVIGTGVILNTGCSVDHDVQLADGVHICPGAHLAGDVKVGARSWVGIGASVIQQVRIGADVTVGAGAAVVCDLSNGVTAVGVPARVLPRT